ncbi:MAG: hypothetical protein HYV97_15785 [Bdellovibrio sp.]|nr:hypothetical protein [Bdellovibrio sp.]
MRNGNNRTILICTMLGLGLISGCNDEKSFEKIREVSDIQAQEAARNGIAAEREYVDSKARAAEVDLERRQRFYQAVAGTYEGSIAGGNIGINGNSKNNFKIRLTLVPSLPRYVPKDRVRTWEEVTADLTGLFFKVQILQWNPESDYAAVGCVVDNVRPDIVNGVINIASEGCANIYNIQIAEENSAENEVDAIMSAHMAEAIIDGKLESVTQIQGKMRPSSNANIFTFSGSRVK